MANKLHGCGSGRCRIATDTPGRSTRRARHIARCWAWGTSGRKTSIRRMPCSIPPDRSTRTRLVRRRRWRWPAD
eukprot:755417-Hanusia_phi.AAC.1